ncbi:thiolase family protein [Desulfosporosinus sp. Sb-LF]|uniref:thiolase family protein n=1 Tax=Desulfosporosinus sp. Sb-LF TaxID=2560027 RepID=UPI00107EED5D|nr:thiolase family protein [Desulfosporosinus sp. Sb-LF]TGE31494.1 thiolase family protein [Desulfosporosinus sp. Sb-LF]
MKEVVLVSAVRTPVCRVNHQFTHTPAENLAALTLMEATTRAGIKAGKVGQIIIGCVLQQGEHSYLARVAGLMAGFPASVPAFTPNNLCCTGLLSVILGTQSIQAEAESVVVVGGSENVSQTPMMTSKVNGRTMMLDMVDVVLTDPILKQRVGWTVEKLAQDYSLTREEQDLFALNSHRKAVQTMATDGYGEEIVNIKPLQCDGSETKELVVRDGGPHHNMKLETLARYKPVFMSGGTVTAGNSSIPADGAASAILMDSKRALRGAVKPLAKVKGYATVGVEPLKMGLASVRAIRKVLKQTGYRLADVDLIECTECFAAQMLAVGKELNWEWQKVNVNGGTLAYGHPFGASGTIQLVRLTHELKRRGGRIGLAVCCAGSGLGAAVLIEAY